MAGCNDVDGIMSELEADWDDRFAYFLLFFNQQLKVIEGIIKIYQDPWGMLSIYVFPPAWGLDGSSLAPGSKCPKGATPLQPGRIAPHPWWAQLEPLGDTWWERNVDPFEPTNV